MKPYKTDDFPRNLKAARLLRGLSQSDLAKIVGLDSHSISHYENGRSFPSNKNLKELSNALNLDVKELVGQRKFNKAYLRKIILSLSPNSINTLIEFADLLKLKEEKIRSSELEENNNGATLHNKRGLR